MNPLAWLRYEFLENTFLAWGTAIATVVGAWLLLGIARRMTEKRLHALAERHELMPLKIAAHTQEQVRFDRAHFQKYGIRNRLLRSVA